MIACTSPCSSCNNNQTNCTSCITNYYLANAFQGTCLACSPKCPNCTSANCLIDTDAQKTLQIGTYLIAAIALTSFIPLAIANRLNSLWNLFDILQLLFYLIYINIDYPIHVISFFET